MRNDLVIFTDKAVVRIENVEKITRGRDVMISSLLPGIKMIMYGLSGRAREFVEWVRSLRGKELSVEEIRRLGRKAILTPYSDVISVKVDKGRTITLEVKARSGKFKDKIALFLYKEVKMTRDDVYKEIKETLRSINALSGKLVLRPP